METPSDATIQQPVKKEKNPYLGLAIERTQFLGYGLVYQLGETLQRKTELSHYYMNKISNFTGVKLDENFLNWHLASLAGAMTLTSMSKYLLDKAAAILPENKLTRFVKKNSHMIAAGAVSAVLLAHEASTATMGIQSIDTKDVLYQTAGSFLAAVMMPKYELPGKQNTNQEVQQTSADTQEPSLSPQLADPSHV